MIEARADEPHHPDLEAPLSPPPHNYTCIIRTHTFMYVHTHIHTIETGHSNLPPTPQPCPQRSLSHIPTSLGASESPWSSNSPNTHTRHYLKGWLHCDAEIIFISRSSVPRACVQHLVFYVLFVHLILPASRFSSPPLPFTPLCSFLWLPLCLSVSSLTLWPLCKTGDDLVFGDVVHANDLSVKAAYSNMTA